MGGGLPGLQCEHFPLPDELMCCDPIISRTWCLASALITGGPSQGPLDNVETVMHLVDEAAASLSAALQGLHMPGIQHCQSVHRNRVPLFG